MKNKRLISMLLLAALPVSAIACGSGESTDTTADSAAQTTAANPYADYEFPAVDWGGKDFRILNIKTSGSYSGIVYEMTGDVLDDAMWKRNEMIEEMFNLTLIEELGAYNEINDTVRSTVLSGDDVYQVAYPRSDSIGGMALDGLFWNLNEGDGFQFDQPWWDQAVMEDFAIGDKQEIYFASSDISLHNFEMSWCLYFNRNQLVDLGLDMPYDTVKAGKWTYDALYKYISVGHNLNGDESYTWNANGQAVYGFTSMQPDAITQMFVSCGEKYVVMNNGQPEFVAGSDKYYSVAEKLAKLFGTAGQSIFANDRAGGFHYELIFGAGRAMFTGCEIKSGDGGGAFANMTDDYGIIPLPKYDEAQENYVSPVAVWTYFMTVPSTNKNISDTSKILDAMAYLSYKDVVPAYYDVTLMLKNIRDDETAEMLDIIRGARTYLTAYAFGWGAGLRSAVGSKISSGDADIASTIAAQKTTIEAEIKKSMDTYSAK